MPECAVLSCNTNEEIDFSIQTLKVTYDPTSTVSSDNPQIRIYYGDENTDYVGVRIPRTTSSSIKWGWGDHKSISENLISPFWWTLTVDDGMIELQSQDGNVYSHPSQFTSLLVDSNIFPVTFQDFQQSDYYEIFPPKSNKLILGIK